MKPLSIIFIYGILCPILAMSAKGNTASVVLKTVNQQTIDKQTPKHSVPFINPDSTSAKLLRKSWKLVFSDEFNDTQMDTTKWNVEAGTKKRVDIMLYAENQVEEKEGRAYIYYRKSNLSDTAYMAGRFNSNKKYAATYGFFECRMHIVKPDGHQTAFWMMPEGNGMKTGEGVDGTANDGAEIDIIEGNKTNLYSTGLHWDGYSKTTHKSNGKLIKTPGIHDTEFHIYGFEWSPDCLRFYIDGKVVREITDPKLIPHVPHFLYFSGSCFGQNDWVDGDIRKNEFIQRGGVDRAYIDYVRVYQRRK